MKPYRTLPIQECGEPLISIPLEQFAVEHPHPYVKLAAPYGDKSPYFLRQGVLTQLITAQDHLQQQHPGWRIAIFDAYRPIAVQQFMVDYTFRETVAARGLQLNHLSNDQRQEILAEVYQFWAVPSPDPAMPPPHSTGAAIDVTLAHATGTFVDMGSPIDELSPRSYPDYFASQEDTAAAQFHHHRQLLKQVMLTAGFRQHPNEWWHFSLGDQLWAWLVNQDDPQAGAIARYGAV